MQGYAVECKALVGSYFLVADPTPCIQVRYKLRILVRSNSLLRTYYNR
jgi:hypothetical protein